MITEIRESRAKNAAIGIALCVLLALATALSIALYNDAFRSTAHVQIKTDRSGLMMDIGSDVKLSGKVVGRVTDVSFSGDYATIDVELHSDQLHWIPENVGAELNASTLFARKYVSLTRPKDPSPKTLASGDVIDASKVTVEFENILGSLMSVLNQVDPAKANTVLTQASTAVQSRGTKLGTTLERLENYLAEFNGSMPALQRDIPKVADNADTFDGLSPDLLSTVDNASVTGVTLTEKQAQYNAFLLSFTNLGNVGHTFVETAGEPLIQSANVLNPVLGLLGDYSSEYQCLFAGLVRADKYLANALGGTRPGLNILGTVPMGDPPYKSPQNLPEVGRVNNAPSCYGSVNGDTLSDPGHIPFDDGSDAYQTPLNSMTDAGRTLAGLLFGNQK